MKNTTAELVPVESAVALREEMPIAQRAAHSPLDILEAAIRGGVTADNVAVVKEIAALCRQEVADKNKAEFNRAFFALKQEIRSLNFYADKEAKSRDGAVMYAYCSEAEIGEKLEPVLARHGFDMLFSQEREGDTVTAVITLLHQSGHEFVSKFTVRVGATNSAKDATAVDAGSTTSAWRHLVMKMFGLKSRISADQDPRNLGDYITPEQADELQRRVDGVNGNVKAFLSLAGAKSFREIMSGKYAMLNAKLAEKEKQGR